MIWSQPKGNALGQIHTPSGQRCNEREREAFGRSLGKAGQTRPAQLGFTVAGGGIVNKRGNAFQLQKECNILLNYVCAYYKQDT